MKIKERTQRIVGRGEVSNHCHVIVGECDIEEKDGKTIFTINKDSHCIIKHILEDKWLSGEEVWTKEHKDIPLEKGRYEIIQQVEYDPYEQIIRAVKD